MFTSALSHKPLPLAHTTNPIHAHTHIFSRSSSSLHHAAATAHAIEQYRNGTRGGQNLSSRYKRLEKSLRGKEAYAQSTGSVYDAPGASGSTSTIVSAPSRKREGPRMFKGFVVPEEPKAPESDECCMAGCAVCIHDLYQDSLTEYRTRLSALRTSLTALNVPEHEWPAHIRSSSSSSSAASSDTGKSVTMSAFEELERQLAAKKKKELEEGREVASMSTEEEFDGDLDDGRNRSARSGRRRSAGLDASAVVEGIRWMLFPNR